VTELAFQVHKDGVAPDKSWIFVFGSNLAGRHGGGAALEAYKNYGAQMGRARGLMGFTQASGFSTGRSYGIPTKDKRIETRSLKDIQVDVTTFVKYTQNNPQYRFWITRVGCGLAGYSDSDIAPMFKGVGTNCSVPEEWVPFLQEKAT